MSRVIVLNCDYTFINTVPLKKAIKYIVNDKVEVVKTDEREIRNCEGTFCIKVPLIVRLIKMIRQIYKSRVPFTKKNLYARDEYKCQYCGKYSSDLTIDHIIPKSRGGLTSFENCVASCKKCNNKKANKTPNEARMPLLNRPVQPTIMEFLRHKMRTLNIEQVLNDLIMGV